jgi:uncharacterized protein YndB with AHSA1/START domain
MEYARIERTIHIDATPDVVFDVITSPAHIREWWNGASFSAAAVPGATGELVWGDRVSADSHVEAITVVDAIPPRLFSFRWVYPHDDVATSTNSLLVTFELVAADDGTTLRLTESGFRERGWEQAVMHEAYRDHVRGWDLYVPAIGEYVDRLKASA